MSNEVGFPRISGTFFVDGTGLWTNEARNVFIHRFALRVYKNGLHVEDFGELRAFFPSRKTNPVGWDIEDHGLIYSDPSFKSQIKQMFKEIGFSREAQNDIDYSEQGMQGEDYVSFDAGPEFVKEWKERYEKVIRPDRT